MEPDIVGEITDIQTMAWSDSIRQVVASPPDVSAGSLAKNERNRKGATAEWFDQKGRITLVRGARNWVSQDETLPRLKP